MPDFAKRKMSTILAVIIEVLGATRFVGIGTLVDTRGFESTLIPVNAAKFALESLL